MQIIPPPPTQHRWRSRSRRTTFFLKNKQKKKTIWCTAFGFKCVYSLQPSVSDGVSMFMRVCTCVVIFHKSSSHFPPVDGDEAVWKSMRMSRKVRSWFVFPLRVLCLSLSLHFKNVCTERSPNSMRFWGGGGGKLTERCVAVSPKPRL